jgi:putative DNA base modification enzyme with NMAD domain
MTREVKIFSYVVDHDHGTEPNPYDGTCTLCECKFSHAKGRRNIVELAEKGNWIIGTGGKSKNSPGHGKLIYAMKVTEKLPREKFYADKRFKKKIARPPADALNNLGRFALISSNFYYFGNKPLDIMGLGLEKRGPGFRYLEPREIELLRQLLKSQKPGRRGDPYSPTSGNNCGGTKCKSCY